MDNLGNFPFGQPVLPVVQADQSPKSVFVLGVYASAVHARWVGPDGKQLVSALAVRSEPEIFWRGDNVEELISEISVPSGCGHLEPAMASLNGPSAVALDERILESLGLDRSKAWFCDLVPYSCANTGQRKAVAREYEPMARSHGLPEYTVRDVPKTLADESRRLVILEELERSEARLLITLGDDPLKWFLSPLIGSAKRLGDFGKDSGIYGRIHQFTFNGRELGVLPLVHPRQAAGLGVHSKKWRELHAEWVAEIAGELEF